MATHKHTPATPDYAPARIPINPLARPYWTLAEVPHDQEDAAILAGITTAVRCLARVLANSEAFRDIHANCESDTVEPGHCPLDAPTTDGLFAALYFLSEQAEALSQLPLPGPEPDDSIDSDDVPY